MNKTEFESCFKDKRMVFFGDEDEYPMECPNCNSVDDLSWDVIATVYSGDSRPTIYWTAWEHFDARCHECDYEGTINEFIKERSPT